jgi:hypothetical protein
MKSSYRRNRILMWIMFAVLVVLHHDWWYWNDGTLLLGFLPIGLAYQMMISVAASALWGWAAFNAWPEHYDKLTAAPVGGDVPNH